MTLKSVMVQLDVEQIAELDRQAQRTGQSRSRLVRDAIDDMLRPPPVADLASRYAAAYPDDVSNVDEWGDLDQWHEAAARDRARSERDPW